MSHYHASDSSSRKILVLTKIISKLIWVNTEMQLNKYVTLQNKYINPNKFMMRQGT